MENELRSLRQLKSEVSLGNICCVIIEPMQCECGDKYASNRFYSGLLDMPVPINKSNFLTYGASTTPTLVLVDRTGKVAWYHPGALPYGELKAEIDKVVAR